MEPKTSRPHGMGTPAWVRRTTSTEASSTRPRHVQARKSAARRPRARIVGRGGGRESVVRAMARIIVQGGGL